MSGPRSARVRIAAAAVVVIFAVVATVTTVVSVGRYCLTSDGGNTAALPVPGAQ
jgi:hypothetical protein